MIIIFMALTGSLAIPLFFLLLLADGRKLREKISERQASRFADPPEEGAPLITSGHGSWLSPPYRMRQDTPASWPQL